MLTRIKNAPTIKMEKIMVRCCYILYYIFAMFELELLRFILKNEKMSEQKVSKQ